MNKLLSTYIRFLISILYFFRVMKIKPIPQERIFGVAAAGCGLPTISVKACMELWTEIKQD